MLMFVKLNFYNSEEVAYEVDAFYPMATPVLCRRAVPRERFQAANIQQEQPIGTTMYKCRKKVRKPLKSNQE